MPTDYREIGKGILEKLKPDDTRLGEALSAWNDKIKSEIKKCLNRGAWNEIPTHCESASKLCDAMQSLDELSDVVDTAHAKGIFHAYAGISYLYQVDKKAEEPEESAELAKAIDCLEKSRRSFHFEYRDQWNEAILCLNLGRLYRSQNKFNDALLAFQSSCTFSNFNRLSIEKRQEIEKVALEEIEQTRRLLGLESEDSGDQEDETAQQHREKHSDARAIDQKPFASHKPEKLPPSTQQKGISFRVLPVMDGIAAGKEKPVSDEIIGYMRQTDEFEFEFEGQALKAELLKGSQLKFLPEYDYVAMLVSGDSMDQAGISPNDYVILQKPNRLPLSPTSGDIVAVVFRDEDGEATLKYIVTESSRVILKPKSSNPEHQTRVLQPEVSTGDDPSVAVVGIAIAVLKP